MEEVELKPENAPVEAPEAEAVTTEPAVQQPEETSGEIEPIAEPAHAAEGASETPAAEAVKTEQAAQQPEEAPGEIEPIAEPAQTSEEEPSEPVDTTSEGASETSSAEAIPEQMILQDQPPTEQDDTGLKAVVEAIVYITEEPVSAAQIAAAIQQPEENVKRALDELTADFARSVHGVMIREVAGGFKMTTKPEHHETLRAFVKSLKPPLKLSLAALETLATIAYKQPITAPEIMEIRGVQGAGVLKTLLDRKLIQTSGRKNVIGRPILYRTTKDFLVQFGLKDLAELPTLKEFEELRRLAVSEPEAEAAPTEQPSEETPAQPVSEAAEDAAPEPTTEPSSEPAAAEPPTENQDA